MNILRAVSAVLVLTLALLSLTCVYRAVFVFKKTVEVECASDLSHVPINEETRPGVIDRFRGAIQFATITSGTRNYDAHQLQRFIQFLYDKYPLIHSSHFVERQLVANYSLLYTISGSDSSLEPYLLCSHLDVVPVEKEKWSVEPFEGLIKDGYIYGRGTLDVKDTLMAIFESLEHLLQQGFQLKRTFYIALGHDEEGSGFEGAQAMAKVLAKKLNGKKLLYLLDEGTVIVKPNTFPGVPSPVALIGVAENGYATFRMTIKGHTGHSSMPPRETSIVKLAKALTRFSVDSHPSFFTYGPEKDLIEAIAPHASYPIKLIYSNLWLFKYFLCWVLTSSGSSVGMTRSTTAVTMISGGIKENVIPSTAYAIINHRIHPADSVDSVLQFDRQLVRDLEDIHVDLNEGWAFEPHPMSPRGQSSFGYSVIASSVSKVFTGTIPAPSSMIASTDTKWYLNLTDSIYRFSPAYLNINESVLFHGHDERISIDNYVKIVNFYHHLMIDSNQKALKFKQIIKDEL